MTKNLTGLMKADYWTVTDNGTLTRMPAAFHEPSATLVALLCEAPQTEESVIAEWLVLENAEIVASFQDYDLGNAVVRTERVDEDTYQSGAYDETFPHEYEPSAREELQQLSLAKSEMAESFTGKHVDALFISVWDGDNVWVQTGCRVYLETNPPYVFDIQTSIIDHVESLDEVFVQLNDGGTILKTFVTPNGVFIDGQDLNS